MSASIYSHVEGGKRVIPPIRPRPPSFFFVRDLSAALPREAWRTPPLLELKELPSGQLSQNFQLSKYSTFAVHSNNYVPRGSIYSHGALRRVAASPSVRCPCFCPDLKCNCPSHAICTAIGAH